MSLLKNKKVIISAGASGIGWATAKVCLEKGAIVFICDIDKKYLSKAKKHKQNNKKLFVYECDASNEKEVKDLFLKINKKTKKIDCLINNVGIAGPTGTIEKLSSNDWERTLKVNVISHFHFTKLSIPMLKKNASKWAIVGITKTLAMELGKFKIRVNAICPGTIKGDRMVRVIRDKSKFLKISKKKIEKEFISMASMNCWIYEEDIGKTCSFLMSDDAARLSGQIIAVDGNAIRLD